MGTTDAILVFYDNCIFGGNVVGVINVFIKNLIISFFILKDTVKQITANSWKIYQSHQWIGITVICRLVMSCLIYGLSVMICGMVRVFAKQLVVQ